MIAPLLLVAAITYPASGSYTYELATPKGARFRTTIVITSSANGVTTHETFGVPTIATTDQQFDSDLREQRFVGMQAATGRSVTITFSQTAATYSVDGKNFTARLDSPDCLLVADNVLTSAIMLPSVLQARDGGGCTYALSTAVATVNADVTIAPLVRPSQAAANDVSVRIDIGTISETVWYDPQTLIPDYIDFGNSGSAVLTTASH